MTATQRLFVDFAEEAKRIRGSYLPMDAVPGLEHMVAYTIRQPIGIVVGIIPFNYPAELFAHKIPGAIAARNSVIVKLPEQCPLTVLEIGGIMFEAGLRQRFFREYPQRFNCCPQIRGRGSCYQWRRGVPAGQRAIWRLQAEWNWTGEHHRYDPRHDRGESDCHQPCAFIAGC
jgi:hypothetical protein